MQLDLDNEAVHGAMDQIPMKDMGRFVGAAMETQAADPALRPGLSEVIGAIQPEAGPVRARTGGEAAGDRDLRA